jgi:hypothetical protein
MKKPYLQFLLLLFPFLSQAQNKPPVYKDFNKRTRHITTSFQLNDHVWVMQTCLDKEDFELAAIDDKMQVLWRSKLNGYAIASGKFKDHILAISAAKYEWTKDKVLGPYTAFLLDEKTGKLLSQKVIFDSKSETQEFPEAFFNEDSSDFTLVIRQSDQGKVMFGFATKLNTIKDLTVIKLGDNLNTMVLKPKFPDEEILNFTCNNKSDLFLVTHKDGKTIKVTRFEYPKYEPQEPIVQDIDLHKASDLKDQHSFVTTSGTDRKIAYFALIYDDPNNDNKLTVCKFNFTTHTTQIADEVFDRPHVKAMEKAYVSFDSKQQKPDFGPRGLKIKYLTEWNSTVVVVFSNQNLVSNPSIGTSYADETSLIINGYDSDLKPKFQQIMPSWYKCFGFVPMTAKGEKNSLYMLANTADGINKWTCYYGQLDLATGSWLKLQKLPKDQLDRQAVLNTHVMWFAGGFIIPYNSLSIPGIDISLQLNTY